MAAIASATQAGPVAPGAPASNSDERQASVVRDAITVLLWVYVCVSLWLIGGPDFAPGGAFFALLLLYTVAWPAGEALKRWTKLPPLLGMLVAGILLQNLPGRLLGGLPPSWSDAVRAMALIVIMLRAGMGLDVRKLRSVGAVTLRLAFVPCLCEAATVATVAVSLLGLPPAWACLLGFVLAAVSPAVVVPGLLSLQARGYGVAKGIPSMVLAAASLDDVLAISGFGICLSLATSPETTDIVWLVFKGPVELVAGTVLGLACGAAAAAIPRDGAPPHARTVALFCGGTLAVFGGRRVNLAGGGALGAVVMGCASAFRWGKADAAPVSSELNAIWTSAAQPLLFGLLGAAVRVDVLTGKGVGLAFALLCCGLAVRIVATRGALGWGHLTQREANFICVSWAPKATVQAAVGGAALDLARAQGLGAEAEAYGTTVLIASVVAIIVTAPIGALGIAFLGPRWLELADPGIAGNWQPSSTDSWGKARDADGGAGGTATGRLAVDEAAGAQAAEAAPTSVSK